MNLLIDRVHSGVQRLQQNVHAQLQLLASSSPPAPAPPAASSALQCLFVPQTPQQRDHPRPRAASGPHARVGDGASDVLTEMDGVSLLIASFLDGETLARMGCVSRAWRAFELRHREALYSAALSAPGCEFPRVEASGCAFTVYLLSLRAALDEELAHSLAVEPVASALEQFCVLDRGRSGFVAMFCDLIEFRDPRIARFVARKRQSALSMVLARTPEDVTAFRRRSRFVGPITFVPLDNPHWPRFEPSPPLRDCPGFLGYAYDHATVLPGFESLQRSVVKSILKELMLFDSHEHAAAYGQRVGAAPFAAIVGDGDSDGDAPTDRTVSPLTFSTPLRRRMRHLTASERVLRLRERIDRINRRIFLARSQR